MDPAENDRYPIGRFQRLSTALDLEGRAECVGAIEQAPAIFRSLVDGLSEVELERAYRPDGWTIRQVVHHVPDSHMNAYIRMKLAVTEETPTIKAYDEARWAMSPEARSAPVAMSLDLLDALHRRWVAFLQMLTAVEFQRTFVHPELGRVSLDEAVAMYAWHGRHHAAHIRNAVRRDTA